MDSPRATTFGGTSSAKTAFEGTRRRRSDNAYRDLGFQDADEMLAKAQIVSEIGRILRAKRLTQTGAAEILGLDQPKVSALLNGHFQGYSQERLLGLLNRMGRDVEIIIRPAKRGQRIGRLSVVLA
jgi:predicted XRE-type DNA-binding protein